MAEDGVARFDAGRFFDLLGEDGGDSAEPDGFVRDWKPSGLTPERHLGYAFQWFALALTLAVLVLVSFLKSRESPE